MEGEITNGSEPSAAEQLLQQHAKLHATVEDVVDEDAPGPSESKADVAASEESGLSEKAAGKQKAVKDTKPFDTQSHEVFPELGAGKAKAAASSSSIWSAKKPAGVTNGKTNGLNGNSRASTPPSGAATPTTNARGGPPKMTLPGRNAEPESITIDQQNILPRGQLKRPLPEIIKDINRRSRARIDMQTLPNGRLRFMASGPQDLAQQALKDLIQQIGSKVSKEVPVPQSVRAHIIGKGGANIQALQEKTGARIQLPKQTQAPIDDDEDATVNVTVEGNDIAVALAIEEIKKIVGARPNMVSHKLRGIPAEFYPFIAGPQNAQVSELEENHGVQIRIPPHQAWSTQPPPSMPAPGQRPTFSAPTNDNHIEVAGERASVQAAKAEIEALAEALRRDVVLDQLPIQRGRHQFIIGDRGVSMDDFFADTGCVVLLPAGDDDDNVVVIGPEAKLSAGSDRAMDLAMNMQSSSVEGPRFLRGATPAAASSHARNLTRYLRQRDEIARLESAHGVFISTAAEDEAAATAAFSWQLYSRDGKNTIRATSEIAGIINGHPPARMASVPVDPLFHPYLRDDVGRRVRKDHGVQLVVPPPRDAAAPVLLVFEGVPDAPDAKYELSQKAPTAADIKMFQQGLREAEKQILDFINSQETLVQKTVTVPEKFLKKLQNYMKKEKAAKPTDQIPVRLSNIGDKVNIKGPESAVEADVAKIEAFIEQAEQDEKERDYTLTFDFPQKYVNHLVGKNGSNIQALSEKFDVEIHTRQDKGESKVEVKGPVAKAELAKTHILAMARNLADEVTHVLKIDQKHHRELIGAQGSIINRLQTRYKVHIGYPRNGKNGGGGRDDQSNAGDAASEAGGGSKSRRDQAPDEVIVRGPKKGADEARDEILSLLQYLKDNSFTATVTIQQKQVPSLIRQGGAGIDELRQASGAKIDIPNGSEAKDGMVDIQIKGTKAQVAAAKKILEEKKSVFDDTVVKTLKVDRKHHKTLIGPSGETIKDIVTRAGGSTERRDIARAVQFPKQENDGDEIKIEGRTDVVEKIIASMLAIVKDKDSQVSEVMDVPIEKHRTLIGRGGEAKRALESKFSVSIDIPRMGDGQKGVKISGKPEAVAAAKAHIEDLTKEQPGETVQVPRALHHVVSNNGQIFRRLRNDFHVTVDHAGQTTPAKPAPTPAAAAAAATTSAATTKVNGGALPLITDDEETASEAYSWRVVEQAAPTASAPVASTEDGDIPWVLRGSAENVAKAKKAVESALEKAKQQQSSSASKSADGEVDGPTFTGYLKLPDPRKYRFVIGQGGSKVNAIRRQSGCRINVPRSSSGGGEGRGGGGGDEPIEVVGSKEGVEMAKDLILEAVRDGGSAGGPPRPRRGD